MQSPHSKYDIGSIHWLPPREKVPLEHLHATVHIDSGCFNHPVLILWVDSLRIEAIILIITSFRGKDLLLRHPHDARARSLHLPIYPSNTHPDNGSRLFLRDDARLPRNSYVKAEQPQTVETVLLVPNRHQECTLRKESYDELVRHMDFHPPVAKFHRKTHSTPNVSGDYREWPGLITPPVGGRVKPSPEGRFVVHVQQTPPPPHHIQQAPRRAQHVKQLLPPRQVQQYFTTPYTQRNTFNFPHTPSCQTEHTRLLQSVRPVSYTLPQPHAPETRSQYPNESSAMRNFMGIIVVGIVVLGIYFWVSASLGYIPVNI